MEDDVTRKDEITPQDKEALIDLVPDNARLEQEDGNVEPDETQKMMKQSKEVLDDSYIIRIEEALDLSLIHI